MNLHAPQLLTRARIVCPHFLRAAAALENEPAGRDERAAGWTLVLLSLPNLFAADRIPGLQITDKLPVIVGMVAVVRQLGGKVQTQVVADGVRGEARICLHREVGQLRRNVEEARFRAVSVRVPAVRALDTGRQVERLAHRVTSFRLDARTPRLQVDTVRPVHGREGSCPQQLAVRGIQHVEEAVLARLHDHVALLSVHVHVRDHHGTDGVIVPGVRRSRLVMPHVLARVGLHGHD